MDDPVVGFDLVGDTKDFWRFGGLSHGHKNLGRAEFFWNGEIFSQGGGVHAVAGQDSADSAVKVGVLGTDVGGFAARGVEFEVVHRTDEVIFCSFGKAEESGFGGAPAFASAASAATAFGAGACGALAEDVVGVESLAGVGGAKVGAVVGVERARISVLLSISVGAVSAMAGAESSGGESSVEGGAEDSGPESAESTFSLVKMERGFPPLKMTTLPRPRRARTWTAMAMRKGVEVRRAVIASHFFFLLLGSVGGVGRGVRMGVWGWEALGEEFFTIIWREERAR